MIHLIGVLLLLVAAGGEDSQPNLSPAPIRLVDVTSESGVDFVHHTGAVGDRWLPETMGSGVVVFDADDDEHRDLLFLDGHSWGGAKEGEGARLYLGRGEMRFEDVTAKASLPSIYGMGGVAADLDEDGHNDLVLTALDGVRVLWGHGDGSFEGSDSPPLADGWCTSLALLDYDRDGELDIFVCRYVQWIPETDIWCSLAGQEKSYCTPEVYEGSTCLLLRGVGERRFEDVSAKAGVDLPAKALGVVCDDFDGDHLIDVFVANDTMPDFLLRNRGDGSFEDIGLAAGVALSDEGLARAGMGVASGDYRGEGKPGIAVGHFSGEMIGLFHNRGEQGFVDEAASLGLGPATLPELTFGTLFVDLDLDGWPDLVTANGHIESEIEDYRPGHRYRQPMGIYRNQEGQGFVRVEDGVPTEAFVGRGLAYGDLDGDGDLDLVMTQNGDRAVILRNDLTYGRGIRFVLDSRDQNQPVGAAAIVRNYEGPTIVKQTLQLGSGYLSCSEDAVTVGCLRGVSWDSTHVEWTDGMLHSFSRCFVEKEQEMPWGLVVDQAEYIQPKSR